MAFLLLTYNWLLAAVLLPAALLVVFARLRAPGLVPALILVNSDYSKEIRLFC